MDHERALRVELPRVRTETTARAAISECFFWLGMELEAVMGPPLAEAFGPDWPQELVRRHGARGPGAAGDVQRLLRELEMSDSPARSVLPRDRQWLDDAQRLRKLRNAVFHTQTDLVDSGVQHAELLERFARRANLACAEEFGAVRDRLAALWSGEVFDVDAEALAAARARADAAELAAAEGAAEARRLAEQSAAKDAVIARRKAEQAAAAESAQQSEEQAARRAEELERAHAEAAAAAERERLAGEHATAAAAEFRLQREAAADAAQHVTLPEDVDLPLDELVARLRQRHGLPATGDLENLTDDDAVGAGEFPAPGQPWPYLVGHERWRLSKQYRSLTRVSDSVDLEHIVGPETAAGLVDAFLRVRPDGGKALVDDDGDAVTWLNGQWVYLGRLSEPAPSAPRPGDALGCRPLGIKYTMRTDGSIRRGASTRELADVVGAARAADVRRRVRLVKPQGGSLWVARDGTVSAYSGNEVVFVTAVARQEWFPGAVD